MREYPHIAERVLNTPLLAHPDKAETVASVVLRRNGVEVSVAQNTHMFAPQAGPIQERRMASRRDGMPFLMDESGTIAIIEVMGSLAHRKGHIGASSGVMGYDGISAQFTAAMSNAQIRGIVFDIHSAGGEVSGAFQLADRIAKTRGQKRMVAIADEMAFSAAYLLASASDEIWLASATAAVGSVGVVMVHFSFEDMLKAEGVKPTIIHAGAQKADGNPYEDLSSEVEGRFQAKVDAVHDQFVRRVAAWRGMSESAVRKTEAGVFMGDAAVGVGFANGIADPRNVLAELADQVKAQPPMGAV